MKIKKLAGILLASGLLLSGCSSSSIVQEDGKDVVASIKDKNILADDLYSSLLTTPTGKSAVFNFALEKIIETYYPVDDDMKSYADDAIENIESQYQSQYGDESETQLESALAQSGFENMDDYREYLIQSLQYSTLIKDYAKNNFDTVFEDYYKQATPRYLTLIKVSVADMDNPTTEEKEKLKEVKALLKTDKDFGEIASSYSDDDSASAKGELGIVDTTTGLSSQYGEDVEEKAFKLKSGEESGEIKGNDGYYFLKCTSTDKEKMKKELKNVDLNSPLLAYDSYMIYLAFNTYDLNYGDEDIKKQITDYVKEALKTRDENIGGNN